MEKITIAGPPFETGKTCGLLFESVLKKRISAITEKDRKQLQGGAEELADIIQAFNPHWLEELEGLHACTGITPEDVILLNCTAVGRTGGDCTSVLNVNPEDLKDNILHKNRDQLPMPQYFFVKQTDGCYKHIAAGSIGDLGIATFLNEKGLAGANNSGSITRKEEISAGGLSDCHVMRTIAEKAASCEEALKIIQNFISERVCGSAGNDRGMIFLFADRGKGLIIENTSKSLVFEFVDRGMFLRTNDYRLPGAKDWIDDSRGEIPPVQSSRLRYLRAEELLRGREADIPLLMQVSRDTENYPFSINNDAQSQPTMTLSSFIHVVRKEMTELFSLSWVCNGNPSHVCFFPFYAGSAASPYKLASCAVNGEVFSKNLRVSGKHRNRLESAEALLRDEEEDFFRRLAAFGDNGLLRKLEEKSLAWSGRGDLYCSC